MAEQTYRDYPQVFATKGVVARYAFDRFPEGTYLNLQNIEARQENALSSRLGRIPLTSDGTTNFPLADHDIHTLAYMRGLVGALFRYAGAGENIYRRAGSAGGAFTQLGMPTIPGYSAAETFSGNRFSNAQYRPDFNANPWIFFADEAAMVKDNGSLNPLEIWGIYPPTIPPDVDLSGFASIIIDPFATNLGYVFTNCSIGAISNDVSTHLTGPVAAGLNVANVADNTNIIPFRLLIVATPTDDVVVTATPGGGVFTGIFNFGHAGGAAVTGSHMSVNLTATEPAIIQLGGLALNLNISNTAQDDNDYIVLEVQNGTANIGAGTVEVRFDVGDGSFTDYYTAHTTVSSSPQTLKFIRSSFTAIGQAGNTGHTWANVDAWQIRVTPPSGVTSGTFFLGSFYLYGSGGLDVTGGVAYDYRYTYFNINTGAESNPSVPLVTANYVSPVNQSVALTLTASPDPQVTHFRIYRRGGTLTAGWFFVAQIPIAQTSYVDSSGDILIASNDLLNIDNDVPVTTSLSVPVATTVPVGISAGLQTVIPMSMMNIFPDQVITVDLGYLQETVIVQSTTASTFTAFFQLTHLAGVQISAGTRAGTPMDLVACAFEQMWLAGDPQNPNRLYYSKATGPESFPPENYIEIGVPSDPIMAVIVLRGQIFVGTTQRIYRVVVYPGITPTAYPTGARHGFISKWAWCIVEGRIVYRSADGIYVFSGDDAQYVSQPVEWIFSQKEPNLGPIPTDLVSLQPLNLNNQNLLMAYNKNEAFYSYFGLGNVQVRMVFDITYQRWRNDTGDYTAMNTEEDTQLFVVGRNDGMIYLDRMGDVDSLGAGSPIAIPLNLETDAKDQGAPKNNKVYNEFTLDVDPNGQGLTATLIFDKGRDTEDDSQVFAIPNDIGRHQYQFQINSGQGVLAKTVSLKVTGDVLAVVHLYEWHIKAAVDAELRQSYDSYWVKDGTDEYKIMKQGYFEYVAQDLQGLRVAVYFDGSDNPAFSFNLPQSSPQATPYTGKTRTVKLVRFPAFKYKTRRIIITSTSDFNLYGDSFVEIKPATTEKGYAKMKFGNISAEGNV